MPQQYKVPQNIDLEDKIVGPFTMKQFGYLMGGGLLAYAIYQGFSPYENGTLYTVIFAAPVVLIALALTFLKINDRPFEAFIVNFLHYTFSPKRRIWQQEYISPVVTIKTPVKQRASLATGAEKQETLDQIATSLELSAGNTGPEGNAGQAPAEPQANQAPAGEQAPGVQGVQPLALGQNPPQQAAQQPQGNVTKPTPQAGVLQKLFSR